MPVAKFLQVSDFHLGRPFGWLPSERRGDRRFDQRRALELSVREAITRGVHALLLPGDAGEGKSTEAEYRKPGHVAPEVIDEIAKWLGK